MKNHGFLKTQAINTLAVTLLFVLVSAVAGQSPTPTPLADRDYEITSSVEIGGRYVDVNGNENKYRSDFGYKSGIRLFDSSFLFENKSKDRNPFDSALFMASGWGSDPSGYFRANFEKTGAYRFNSSIRQVRYFNNLNNHALNTHNADTTHKFGDVDLTIFPEWDKLRISLGYGFNRTDGPGSFTTRAYSDEFPVISKNDTDADDFRAGLDTKLAGFGLGFHYGHRRFDDRTSYFIDGFNPGLNPTNNARLFTFERNYPVKGSTDFGMFSLHRNFADRFDFTARLIHSLTSTRFALNEAITGRDNSNNIVDIDRFAISGDSKRPQTRGDIGMTWRVTDKLRISDTLTYDQFHISGGNRFFQEFRRRNAAGTTVLAPVFTSNMNHRVTGYKRTSNLIEGSYDFSPNFGFNVGYRYSHRKVDLENFTTNFLTGVTTTAHLEEFSNNTNSFLAGMRIKPVKNWLIFADVEHGKADNVFTRLANNEFTNVRFRTRASFNKFAVSASFLTRDNNNPSESIVVPAREFIAESRSRTFTGSIDWNPLNDFMLSTGYTYQHLTAHADILVPVSGSLVPGTSDFYIRNGYFFVDLSAKPIDRVSLFASYRIDDDRGQGDRFSTLPQIIIAGYPMRLHSPEARIAIKLNRYVDWNLGYQYFNYKEIFPEAQNYNAHLPYMSVRIFLGKGKGDR